MRLPWKRSLATVADAVPLDWIEAHAWLDWEAPRNYVAGEASYLNALERLTGPPCAGGYCLPATVVLVREPGNQYDPNAIRADVAGTRVGYLRRQLADQIAPTLDRAGLTSFAVAGLLRGGSTSAPNVGCHICLDRIIGVDGPSIKLPPDLEWAVPWPINEWEKP